MASYKELGERLGLDICTDVECGFRSHDVNHQTGGWDREGRFHWAERAMRRSSIRNFVWRLSAMQASPDVKGAWQRYWYRVQWAKDALRTLRVRLPASAWDHQRATLRALLAVRADAGTFFVADSDAPEEVTRMAATRWAKRPIEQPDRAD